MVQMDSRLPAEVGDDFGFGVEVFHHPDGMDPDGVFLAVEPHPEVAVDRAHDGPGVVAEFDPPAALGWDAVVIPDVVHAHVVPRDLARDAPGDAMADQLMADSPVALDQEPGRRMLQHRCVGSGGVQDRSLGPGD